MREGAHPALIRKAAAGLVNAAGCLKLPKDPNKDGK